MTIEQESPTEFLTTGKVKAKYGFTWEQLFEWVRLGILEDRQTEDRRHHYNSADLDIIASTKKDNGVIMRVTENGIFEFVRP